MGATTLIFLDPDSESFIQKQLKTGRYVSPSDVIEAGLRLLERKRNRGCFETHWSMASKVAGFTTLTLGSSRQECVPKTILDPSILLEQLLLGISPVSSGRWARLFHRVERNLYFVIKAFHYHSIPAFESGFLQPFAAEPNFGREDVSVPWSWEVFAVNFEASLRGIRRFFSVCHSFKFYTQ